ncbi:MAG: IS66 family transposase zinc-finger binding domain-containing protein, partial [Desulfovibrionaceae bacterium]|nr:IS66 family transposase zinc-finger binding domain-containing protein [Desulfovibrionaceae bacterium]
MDEVTSQNREMIELNKSLALEKLKNELCEDYLKCSEFDKLKIQAEQIAKLREELDIVNAKYQFLLEDNDALRRRIFGSKSERSRSDDSDMYLLKCGGIDVQEDKGSDNDNKVDDNQNSDEHDDKHSDDDKKKKRKKNRGRGNMCQRKNNVILGKHLKRNRIDLSTGNPPTCVCGTTMVKVGETVTEKLEFIPGHFEINEYHSDKYACHNCEPPDGYEGPSTLEDLQDSQGSQDLADPQTNNPTCQGVTKDQCEPTQTNSSPCPQHSVNSFNPFCPYCWPSGNVDEQMGPSYPQEPQNQAADPPKANSSSYQAEPTVDEPLQDSQGSQDLV